MRAEELRIGNFIGLNLEEFPENYFRVLEPAEKSMKVTGYLSDVQRMETDFFDADLMDGIPITELWLKRFGFNLEVAVTWSFGYEKKYNVWRKNLLTYNQLQAAWWYDGKLLNKQPTFVHEIQNISFVLSGEELKLN